jgi:amidase
MQTTAGSLALEGNIAAKDAFIVKQLRKAGALILGKTNLSEWANFRGKRSVSGWSSRGGLTRNPYALDRSASGSSSGSGVAVAANLCAAAVGTEPMADHQSSQAWVVGIKPTLGLLVSRIIPSHLTRIAGPMAHCRPDRALLGR